MRTRLGARDERYLASAPPTMMYQGGYRSCIPRFPVLESGPAASNMHQGGGLRPPLVRNMRDIDPCGGEGLGEGLRG